MDTDKEYDDLDKRELTIMGRLFWGTVILTVGLFLWSVGVYAQERVLVAQIESNSLSLFLEKPCELGGWFKDWKQAEYFWDGKLVAACWRLDRAMDGPFVATVDANGDSGAWPIKLFRPREGT